MLTSLGYCLFVILVSLSLQQPLCNAEYTFGNFKETVPFDVTADCENIYIDRPAICTVLVIHCAV